MRFELIDRVLERRPNGLSAIKTVTLAEEYLADHFPSFPVLPGVLMLEVLVQAARTLIAEGIGDAPPPAGPLVVREVRNVRYGSFVSPGQTLTVEVTLRKQDDAGYEFQGIGHVEEQVAVQGRFRLAVKSGSRSFSFPTESSSHTQQSPPPPANSSS